MKKWKKKKKKKAAAASGFISPWPALFNCQFFKENLHSCKPVADQAVRKHTYRISGLVIT